MRFPRRATIFRGQLEFAPFASVLLVLVLLILVHSRLVFIPGIPLQMLNGDAAGSPPSSALTVQLRSDGSVQSADSIRTVPEFVAWLRSSKETNQALPRLRVTKASQAPRAALEQIVATCREIGLTVETPDAPITLPNGPNQALPAGEYVVVAVNVSGQCFFANQWVREDELAEQLRRAAARAQSPLTLVLMADRGVPQEVIVRLVDLANSAGIHSALQSTRTYPRVSPPKADP